MSFGWKAIQIRAWPSSLPLARMLTSIVSQHERKKGDRVWSSLETMKTEWSWIWSTWLCKLAEWSRDKEHILFIGWADTVFELDLGSSLICGCETNHQSSFDWWQAVGSDLLVAWLQSNGLFVDSQPNLRFARQGEGATSHPLGSWTPLVHPQYVGFSLLTLRFP